MPPIVPRGSLAFRAFRILSFFVGWGFWPSCSSYEKLQASVLPAVLPGGLPMACICWALQDVQPDCCCFHGPFHLDPVALLFIPLEKTRDPDVCLTSCLIPSFLTHRGQYCSRLTLNLTTVSAPTMRPSWWQWCCPSVPLEWIPSTPTQLPYAATVTSALQPPLSVRLPELSFPRSSSSLALHPCCLRGCGSAQNLVSPSNAPNHRLFWQMRFSSLFPFCRNVERSLIIANPMEEKLMLFPFLPGST